jgi:hypothetical protein
LKLRDAEEEIFSGLLDLTREGGPGNFLVIEAGDVYVQFAGEPGSPLVRCESISNQYLPDKLKIFPEAIEKLKKLGFDLGGDEIENFSRTYEVSTEDQARELAQSTLRILAEIYGVTPAAEVDITLSLE